MEWDRKKESKKERQRERKLNAKIEKIWYSDWNQESNFQWQQINFFFKTGSSPCRTRFSKLTSHPPSEVRSPAWTNWSPLTLKIIKGDIVGNLLKRILHFLNLIIKCQRIRLNCKKFVSAYSSSISRVDSLLYSPALPSRLTPCCQPLAL